MIIGTGIDAVEIARCADWHTYPAERLQRIFSQDELSYCLANQTKSAERFAARFAAKEALLKALYAARLSTSLILPAVCRAAQVVKTAHGCPILQVDWARLNLPANSGIKVALSITHTQSFALAQVIIQANTQ